MVGALTLPAHSQEKGKAKGGKQTAWPDTVTRQADLVYRDAEGLPLKVDLYLPREKPVQPPPVVIWVHGGGWSQGSKDRCPASWLAAEGFAVAGDLGGNRLFAEGVPLTTHDELYKARVLFSFEIAKRLVPFVGGGVAMAVQGSDTLRFSILPEGTAGIEL